MADDGVSYNMMIVTDRSVEEWSGCDRSIIDFNVNGRGFVCGVVAEHEIVYRGQRVLCFWTERRWGYEWWLNIDRDE